MSDAAITSIVAALATIVVVWLRLRYGVEAKVEHNTKITRRGTRETRSNSMKVDDMSKKLNGGIDDAITKAVKPLEETLKEHAAADERNVQEVNLKIEAFKDYVKVRNHDVLDALQGLKNDVRLALELIRQSKPDADKPVQNE